MRYGRNVVTHQVLGDFLGGAPVARPLAQFTDYKPFGKGPCRLHIGGIGSVVSNMRIGQNNDLARIGGVGENFLIAEKGGIENNLTRTFAGGAETAPPIYLTVF